MKASEILSFDHKREEDEGKSPGNGVIAFQALDESELRLDKARAYLNDLDQFGFQYPTGAPLALVTQDFDEEWDPYCEDEFEVPYCECSEEVVKVYDPCIGFQGLPQGDLLPSKVEAASSFAGTMGMCGNHDENPKWKIRALRWVEHRAKMKSNEVSKGIAP